jgi:hypothetical protein
MEEQKMRKQKTLKTLVILVLAVVMACTAVMPTGSVQAASGYGFKSKGVTIKPGGSAKKFIKANKKWLKKTKNSKSCVAESGYDVTRVYKYFTIVTYASKKNGTGVLESISITNKSVKTPEGLSCGDDVDAIKKCYSKAKKTGKCYSVTKGKTKIVISVEDDVVTEIEYLYTGKY